MSAVCFCASSLLSASDVGSSSTLIGYRGYASRVGALKVQFSELRALVRWARYCVYVRNYVQLPRLTPPTQRFNASTRVTRLDQWFPIQKCRFSTPLTRATRLVWPYHRGVNAPNAPTPGVQKSELSTLQRVALSRDSQSAWSLTRRHWQRVVSLDRSIRPTSFFILGGNSNIVTLLNAFMETFLARNVHFTFIMFAR